MAGGESRRFGSDKALAIVDGQYLIDHAIALLSEQSDHIVICGREYGQYDFVMDRPVGVGPLGAINAALKYANENDYDAVISFPCDTVKGDTIVTHDNDISQHDAAWFEHDNHPQYMVSQPVIGYWPAVMGRALEHWLTNQDRRAMMAWAEHCGAVAINSEIAFRNINKLSDIIS